MGRSRLRRRLSWLVVLMLLATATPVSAVAPGGSLNVPDPPDWGVLQGLKQVQENETAVRGDPAIVADAEGALVDVVALDAARSPAVGDIEILESTPPAIQKLVLEESVGDSPYANLTNFLQILLDQPLTILVHIKSGEYVNWLEVLLRPSVGLWFDENGFPHIINFQMWEYVDIDNDTTTGDNLGRDVRLRFRPVLVYHDRQVSILPRSINIELRGGFMAEMERLGTGSEDLPIETTFYKSFRYSNLNYTWFLEYKLDRLPARAQLSLTADQVNITSEAGSILDLFLRFINGSLQNETRLTDISGPYYIEHKTTEELVSFKASLGYLRIRTPSPTQGPELLEASWLTVIVDRAVGQSEIPRRFSIWLDSPSFNRSFDHLNWTADIPCVLALEYYDDRVDYTQARGAIEPMPDNFRIEIDNVTEAVGDVSKIHYTTSEPVDYINFDEWEFVGNDRNRYLHSHVRLEDLPLELWVNGTLDIGGKVFDSLDPDPEVRNFVPQLLDSMMVRLASKLFTVGRTIRSVPQNILDMPDKQGYTSIELPSQGTRLGKLELWLTSNHHVSMEEEDDFFAFYNDTVGELAGKMVETSFSGRLLDIRSFHATFSGTKRVELESLHNHEFSALFIDPKNDANASLWFSNIPGNLSLELSDEELAYTGDGSVDRIQYTSEIQDQYMRLILEGMPDKVRLYQGDQTAGLTTILGEIASLDLQVTDGPVKRMEGDHVLVDIDEIGTTAASVHLTGLRSIIYNRTETNHVSLRTGGERFRVLIDDAQEDLHLRSSLDPLPHSLDADVTDVLGIGEIKVPSLMDVTSVLDFASIIYAVSGLGMDVIAALGDVSKNLVEGLGTFSSDFTFNYTGSVGMDLVATIQRFGPLEVEPVEWVHGATGNQLPHGDDVLLDAKLYLTGLPQTGTVSLSAKDQRTDLSMELLGFEPAYDHLLFDMDGASLIDGGGGRDIMLYIDGLGPRIDRLALELGLEADMRVGGRISGEVHLEASHDLGALHLRMRTRQGQVATVELLMPAIPMESWVGFSYEGTIHLDLKLSRGLEFAFIKLSRDLIGGLDPTASITLHDIPTAAGVAIEQPDEFDMDATTPVANLPTIIIGATDGGLDVLADIEGRAMGNKADVYIDARDLKDVSMTPSGEEYRIAAEGLSFVHMRVTNLVYSKSVLMNRIDLAAEDVERAIVKVRMVFGVYPLISIKEMRVGGLQITFDGSMVLGGRSHRAHIVMVDIPVDLGGVPRTHSNGLAMRATEDDHRLIVPAPVSTFLGTLLD